MWQSAILITVAVLAGGPARADAEPLAGADARIREHRTSEAVVTVLDASGQPLPPDTAVHIEQTRHAFLFGCNIFALDRLRTPEDNAAYAKRFAERFHGVAHRGGDLQFAARRRPDGATRREDSFGESPAVHAYPHGAL